MIVLGKFKEIYNTDGLPRLSDNIGHPNEHKKLVLDYMRTFKSTSASPAKIKDVISGQEIDLPLECKTDGVYGWRTDFMYYIEKYDLKIPNDFVEYVISKTA
jgi:hypothetical protein